MDRKVTTLLRQTDLFARVTEDELRRIAKLLKERRLGRNEVLFRQGDEPDSLYIVTSGRLRISATDRVGNERVLAFLGTGEIVGEMGLLSGNRRSATAVASTDAELLQLRKRDFDSLMASNLDAMRDLARAIARRRQTTQKRIQEEAAGVGGYRYGLVTSVFSPRGGAGTSTIATNLAVALAQRAPDQAVLLDLNLAFGHVPVLLNLVPRTSLAAISAVSLRETDRENLEFYLTRHTDSSLRVLSGALRPEQSELVTAEHAKAAVEIARKYFAHVIVDLPRNFSDVNLAAIEATHNLLVVCTPEPVGVRAVTEAQRLFRQVLHGPGEPMQYVLNRPTPYTRVPPGEISRMLQMPLLADIPFGGEAVTRSALEGQPLVLRSASCPTSKAINHLADLLERQLDEARAMAPEAYLAVATHEAAQKT